MLTQTFCFHKLLIKYGLLCGLTSSFWVCWHCPLSCWHQQSGFSGSRTVGACWHVPGNFVVERWGFLIVMFVHSISCRYMATDKLHSKCLMKNSHIVWLLLAMSISSIHYNSFIFPWLCVCGEGWGQICMPVQQGVHICTVVCVCACVCV